MYNRVKGPLFEHWKRAFSFALYKQTVECIHQGVTNAKTMQQQGNGPDGYGCDLHHEDLEQEVRRYNDYVGELWPLSRACIIPLPMTYKSILLLCVWLRQQLPRAKRQTSTRCY